MSGAPGALFVVATPIGNLEDMSPRAVATLGAVDLVAAEDTRVSRRLLNHFGIRKTMVSLHEHNERDRVEALVTRLGAGEDIALIADAGTPLVSDPGFHLVAAAHEAGVPVHSLPGPSAVVALLAGAGLPGAGFRFAGFPPARPGERQRLFRADAARSEVSVYFEAPHRIAAAVADMAHEFGGTRLAAVGRELTKRYEEIHRAPLADLGPWLAAENGRRLRGEFVVAVAGNPEPAPAAPGVDDATLVAALLAELPPAKAAAVAAKVLHRPKKALYDLAVSLGGGGAGQ